MPGKGEALRGIASVLLKTRLPRAAWAGLPAGDGVLLPPKQDGPRWPMAAAWSRRDGGRGPGQGKDHRNSSQAVTAI